MKPVLALLLSCALAMTCTIARAQSTELAVETLECRGNTRTSCAYILQYVALAAGDRVDETALADARFRLAALPNFSAVDIYLLRGESKGLARVVVEVAERDPLAMEFVAGSTYYLSSISQRLAGRIAHQNLFGHGKIIEALVDARVPMRDPSRKTFHARVQYVDPQLAQSARYYFIAGVSTTDDRTEERNGTRVITEGSGVDVAVGRRLWNYSFVALGYRYNWESRASSYVCRRRDPCEFDDRSSEHNVSLSYGWNSEDDPYFPTQGSRLILSTGGVGLRKTWRTGDGALLTLNALGTPGTEYRASFDENFAFGFTYARPIAAHDALGILRGRWYVQAGWDQVEAHGTPTEISTRAGIKVGVRLDTKSFGIVDLYAMALGEATLWE